jgi:hypothetical protein
MTEGAVVELSDRAQRNDLVRSYLRQIAKARFPAGSYAPTRGHVLYSTLEHIPSSRMSGCGQTCRMPHLARVSAQGRRPDVRANLWVRLLMTLSGSLVFLFDDQIEFMAMQSFLQISRY